MRKETYEFICPVSYLAYIINADIDSVTKDEVNRIEAVLLGFHCFSVKDSEPFFTHRNDFNELGGDCVTLTALTIYDNY